MVTRMTQLGPGMYSQSQGPCDDCRGKGEVIDEANKCKTCNGKKVTKEKKIIEVEIDKGTPDKYEYKFHGEADEYPGMEAGDVVIVCQEQPHKRFKRKGADLLIEKTITLVDALTGVDFTINHLDGTPLRIKNDPGEVIKPDDLKTLENKGLPFHKRSYEFGNLYVKFNVTFPDALTKPQLTSLNKALGKADEEDEEMDGEVCLLKKYSETQRNTHAQGGTKAADSEDEEDDEMGGGRGQRVQCASQ